ncbi:riboflavin synthase [Arthrobacter sp. zg-Y20]|uniref:riboflavin synthase n=1 Tax=unclassified Arthrobacter TaxID=235627 RepID=UPI001D15A6E9|nr:MULTISPECIES: riboflavin synthase [unclassified Arthrobacter]MCC3274491.1 riboflavin synthase [Arthrobacter sp. zg-Y20]MDK1314648.1 riboflavin synthase [Arthrobacter sp. zg.Y20]WIB07629.1 riboflavin synthase [Arthrobacter sp. zg-Y20]
MFTGIVAEQGSVVSLAQNPDGDGAVLVITAPKTGAGLGLGGSIAVDGVCLTATEIRGGAISVDVMGETLKRTTVGDLEPGAKVNLERCVPAGGRLDGHVVQGHVDGVGRLLEREHLGSWDRLRFAVPAGLAKYIAEKGSIAVDGVSLTVTAVSGADAEQHWFEVGLIPTTLAETGLGALSVGSRVNLEVDVLAKYAERLLAFANPRPPAHSAAEPASGDAASGDAVSGDAVSGDAAKEG